jgi:hypothetical protein
MSISVTHDVGGLNFTLTVHGQKVPLDRADAAEVAAKLHDAVTWTPDNLIRQAIEHAYQIRGSL